MLVKPIPPLLTDRAKLHSNWHISTHYFAFSLTSLSNQDFYHHDLILISYESVFSPYLTCQQHLRELITFFSFLSNHSAGFLLLCWSLLCSLHCWVFYFWTSPCCPGPVSGFGPLLFQRPPLRGAVSQNDLKHHLHANNCNFFFFSPTSSWVCKTFR